MNDEQNWLEQFWADILSRNAELIRHAFEMLEDIQERQAVLAHLSKMATEEGWAESQRISAQAALRVLKD
ncbi:MAG: hypothetical protein CUN55_11600 [Phototrophicales bacterium]|nr:MAG: hypothetical protein CUN55_11600 [Phototrophicales bacterium]